MKHLFILPLLTVCAVAQAQAQTWTIAPGSRLTFDTSFEGAPLHGRFERFSGRISLDAKHPTDCRFDVRISLAETHTQNATGDKQLQGVGFFDVAAHPQARYLANRCRWDGKDAIDVLGTLTLRGVKKPVRLRAVLSHRGAQTRLAATATVNRLDFGVGQGQWARTSVISSKVAIKAHLVLTH